MTVEQYGLEACAGARPAKDDAFVEPNILGNIELKSPRAQLHELTRSARFDRSLNFRGIVALGRRRNPARRDRRSTLSCNRWDAPDDRQPGVVPIRVGIVVRGEDIGSRITAAAANSNRRKERECGKRRPGSQNQAERNQRKTLH